MVRTVRVRLELDRTDYKQGLKDAADDMRTFDGRVKKAGVEMKDAGTNARKLGDDAKKSSQDVTNLAKAIEDTKRSLADLGAEYKRSGSVELQHYRSLTSELRKLEKAKRDLDRLGGGGNQGQGLIGGALGSGLNAISGTAPTGLVQWLVAGAAAAAPAIGAAINAGVLLGVGGGGLAAGIVGALQDPRVKATWADFGDFLKSGLAGAADSFVGPMEDAAITLRGDLSQVFTSLSHDLDVLAPSLTRLASGFGGFLTNMMPGFDSALQASAPLLNALADELPRLGTSMSFFLDQIAQGGPGAVLFFKDLMTTIEGTLGTLGLLTDALSKVYEFTRTQGTAAGLTGLGGSLMSIVQANNDKKKSDVDAAQAAADHRVQMTDEAFAAQQAKISIDQLSAAIDKEVGAALAAKDTHLAFNQSILDLKQSVQENGRSLDDTTAKGIANSQALLRMAQAAEADRQSVLQQTGSVQQATGVFDAHMRQVYATAAALGLDKQKTDELIGSVRSIPHESSTDIQLKGANVAEDDIRTFKNYLSSIPPSKTVYIDVVTSQVGGPVGVRGPTVSRANRYGGVYEHAAVGKLRDASISSPMSPARYAYAEPQTGGEAFIPKYGHYGRSMSILGKAASWYGASIVPGRVGGTQTVVHEHHVTLAYPDGRKIAELVINDADRGGSAMTTFIRRVANR